MLLKGTVKMHGAITCPTYSGREEQNRNAKPITLTQK